MKLQKLGLSPVMCIDALWFFCKFSVKYESEANGISSLRLSKIELSSTQGVSAMVESHSTFIKELSAKHEALTIISC